MRNVLNSGSSVVVRKKEMKKYERFRSTGTNNEANTIEEYRWVRNVHFTAPPFVSVFKRVFSVEHSDVIRIRVSADERYHLYLDGELVGVGSERGCREMWFYETYDLNVEAGEHTLIAKVWALGNKAPLAQISVNPGGFILAPEDIKYRNVLGTGHCEWFSKELKGFSYHEVDFAFGMKYRECIDGRKYDSNYRQGTVGKWSLIEELPPITLEEKSDPQFVNLTPASLPAMIRKKIRIPDSIIINKLHKGDYDKCREIVITEDVSTPKEKKQWAAISEQPVVVGPDKTLRIILPLDDYYCIYPEIKCSKGADARIRINFAESAYLTCDHKWNQHFRHPKGDRSKITGKYFAYSMGSSYISNGSSQQLFDPLWWFAGLYVELVIETGNEKLLIEDIALYETRYPLEMKSCFDCSDKSFNDILDMCFRTLQVCTHETYMDCPFYEQVMYVGDARIESLVTFISSLDGRMPEKAIKTFNASRQPNGLNMSCYPFRGRHIIPPFSLLWIALISDHAYWKDDSEYLVCSTLKDMRRVIDYFLSRKNADGLISPGEERKLDAFNFIDWVDQWGNDWGVPKGDNEINSVFHWLFIYTLVLYSDLERNFGDSQLAQSALDEADIISRTIIEGFWDDSRMGFADDLKKTSFSEHSLVLAILSGCLTDDIYHAASKTLFEDDSLLKTTIYFSHYYFEACRLLERMDCFWKRMGLWYELKEKKFKTVYESTLPTRSDCHAWAAHPLYHYFASILGIRPAEYGFRTVEIKPQLAGLEYAVGSMVHKNGLIQADLKQKNGKLAGIIILPKGLEGNLIVSGSSRELREGVNEI